jgi:hypothetical protein
MNDTTSNSASGDNSASIALVNTIKRRIESRYRRILFVHKELAKLDAAAKQQKKTAGISRRANDSERRFPSGSFEDFVFSRIDFSVYKKIDAEEFRLLFDEGLDDYTEMFYQQNFNMSREETRKVIARSYLRIGPFYLCKKASPLLLSIMRTVHTSLQFAPLLDAEGKQLRIMAELLDGVVIRQSDNTETKLFVPAASSGGKNGAPLLCGTFYPLGKACTITLVNV